MKSIRMSFFMLAFCGVLCGCQPRAETMSTTPGEGAEAKAEEFERGPNRGRLLREGNFALELQIFEEGVPPEYHVYLYRDNKPIPPNSAQVTVDLKRLDGEMNHYVFAPDRGFLRGNAVVKEPHSFQVAVNAMEGGREHRWTFDSFEGRVSIAQATAEAAGVRTANAGPAVIKDRIQLTGRLVPNAERTRSVSARFPGAIRQVVRSVGDNVREGERLATIESNESLQTYTVTAPITGVITERRANPGENAGTDALFVIADYGTLWAELNLFPRDLGRVKVGQKVMLKSVGGDLKGEGTVVRVAPSEGTQRGVTSGVYTARVTVSNADKGWTPGLFVEGSIDVAETNVPLAVKRSGLQGFRDFTVVFEQVGETYEVRMLELGRQDDTLVEVLGGLKPGTRYVTENSYLIKADIEKSGASHDH
jgi:membrane fusion protein, heavy metal efflux system